VNRLTLKVSRCFDGEHLREARSITVTVRGETIEDVRYDAPDVPGDPAATVIDASGLTLLPGLIDAHFHPVSGSFDIGRLDAMHPSLRALDARAHLEGALSRGFTTVRDAGGGDIGLVRATERGLIRGPRLLIAGKALSQTGGHGDMRPGDAVEICGCGYHGALSAVVDGPEQVRQVVRDQLRQGATHVKLFLSGGVLSPTDPIWMNQFTDAEIRAAVEEAATRRTYVMAHAHTAEAARRCVANGVRSVEHGTLMDRESADVVAAAGAFVVPTLGVIAVLREESTRLPPGAAEKLAQVADHAAESVALCARAGVKLGFGTDLFGELRDRQADEFAVRGGVQSAIDVLRSATSVNAELIGQAGRLGSVKPGALADLIVVEGNPLDDLSVLADPARHLRLVIRGGEVVINRMKGVLQ
jgi:imidazolonepropionase-like amidohydrolase